MTLSFGSRWIAIACLTFGLAHNAQAQTVTYSRTENITYEHNFATWVIGQTKKVECIASSQTGDGCGQHPTSETDFDPSTSLPLRTRSYGKIQQEMGYHPSGTLAWFQDGRGADSRMLFPSWRRGVPESIGLPVTADEPSGSSRIAAIDAHGRILSVTDETGAKTCYAYDAMHRITKITYPSEAHAGVCDTSSWNATDLTFTRVPAAHGIGGTYWRQTITTGTGVRETHFDAMWRPVLEIAKDTVREDSGSQVVKRYDAHGRLAFQSYPVRLANPSVTDLSLAGTISEYDGLDRVTAVRQHSELGLLSTTTEYLHGAQTRVTNPRMISTTTQVEAYDDPSAAMVRSVTTDGQQFTRIVRDVAGQPRWIRRHNLGYTEDVFRRYAYEPLGRTLCKITEPETGATVQAVDGAGNVLWSVPGIGNHVDPDLCEYDIALGASNIARQANRSYDARNRLKTLRFSDTRGDQDWTYWPDGQPKTVVTVNVPGAVHPQNNYVYNRRRLLTTETQVLPAWYTYNLGYGYDRNGSLAEMWYPSGGYVSYAPNALGQATQASSDVVNYATGVSYHPNGTIKQFTYGNGIVHTMSQNLRQLPDEVRSAFGSTNFHHDAYDYDVNGNVAAISDGLAGHPGDRTMFYDSLDRLTRVVSPMYAASGGEAAYAYNSLDDLTQVKAPGRHHFYGFDVHRRLENVRSGSAAGPTVIGLAYDAQGNLQNRNGQIYDFDHGNRLREIMGVERYRYDAHGRRILAMNFGQGLVLSQYGLDGKLYFQINERPGQQKKIDHIYLGGSLIAQREHPTAGGAMTIKFQHTDALHSPVLVTGQARNEIERASYEPYGRQLSSPANTGNDRPGFTGHVEDRATGLTYMQQRFYDPLLGVLLSVDPVTAYGGQFGQFNRYRYANGNPYAFTDPDGRCPQRTGTRLCGTGAGPTGVVSYGRSSPIGNNYGSRSAASQQGGGGAREISSEEADYRAEQAAMAERAEETFKNAGKLAADEAIAMIAGGPIGKLVGKVARYFGLGRTAVRFGNNPNQTSHTFRHAEGAGLSRSAVERAVLADLRTASSRIQSGKPFNQPLQVGGVRIRYTAYLMQDGSINVGRIDVLGR